MKVTHNAPDLLIIEHTRWKRPLLWGLLTLFWLAPTALLVWVATVPTWVVIVWLLATVGASLPMALFGAEKSMLILNATTARAELRRRDIRGFRMIHWPLDEVQSTRVIRRRRDDRPASEDPKRDITLYVREGMDEGRYPLTKHQVPADDALTVSAKVSDWMQDWRKRVDSPPLNA